MVVNGTLSSYSFTTTRRGFLSSPSIVNSMKHFGPLPDGSGNWLAIVVVVVVLTTYFDSSLRNISSSLPLYLTSVESTVSIFEGLCVS